MYICAPISRVLLRRCSSQSLEQLKPSKRARERLFSVIDLEYRVNRAFDHLMGKVEGRTPWYNTNIIINPRRLYSVDMSNPILLRSENNGTNNRKSIYEKLPQQSPIETDATVSSLCQLCTQ
jgi:hypothetical protein